MEIQSSLEGLKSLLGVSTTATPATQANSAVVSESSGIGADRATLSNAASEMAQSTGDDGVRMDKVNAVQAALADGTYAVSSSAVASKLVESMLGGQSTDSAER